MSLVLRNSLKHHGAHCLILARSVSLKRPVQGILSCSLLACLLSVAHIALHHLFSAVYSAWHPLAVFHQLARNFGISNNLTINNNIDDYEFHLFNDTRITALVETKALEVVNFSPTTRYGEADDWDFWLRFIGMGFKTTMLPEPLFQYRTAVGSMSWPWSMGQAALTAELLSRRIVDAVKSGNAPEDLFLDIMTSRELLRLQAEERSEASWTNSNEAAVLRAEFISAARARHPLLGRFLSLTYRGSSWLARKSIGGSL